MDNDRLISCKIRVFFNPIEDVGGFGYNYLARVNPYYPMMLFFADI